METAAEGVGGEGEGEGDGGQRAAEDAEKKPQVLCFGGDVVAV